MKRQYAGWPMPKSPVERFERYGPYVGAQWRARIIFRRAPGTGRLRAATNWPEQIGLVTYSKTPLSRVFQRARNP